MLAGGFIGGAYAGLTGVIDATLVPSSNVFAALCFLGKSQANVVNGIIACVIAFVSTALLVYFFGFDKNEKIFKHNLIEGLFTPHSYIEDGELMLNQKYIYQVELILKLILWIQK